ncbi:MAG: M10 family metallopeptidase C-terminal domain-containing protein [Chlorobium sp.]
MPTAFSTTQIITQLTTSWGGTFTGYTFSWPSSLKSISFSINTATPTNVTGVTPSEGGAFLVKMDAIQVATATLAFQLWDDVIATTLVKSTSPSANITLNYSSNTSGNGTYTQLWGTANNTTQQLTLGAGQVWLSSTWATNADSGMTPGGYGLFTMIHEIGHALGLSHPGDYNAGSGTAITYANNAVFAQDNRQYTVMSYFGGYLKGVGWQQDGTSANYIYPQTLMVYDMAAIQAKYGADTKTRTTNTVYGFNCSLAATDPEDKIFDFTLNANPIFTIWDAGGTDTLDGSGYAGNQTINLAPGAYSSVDGMIENVAIAFNCWIEAAVGGKGADTIFGNDVNNIITGGVGADKLDGANGADLYMIYSATEHPAGEIIADTGTLGIDEVRFASITANDTLIFNAGDTGIESLFIGTGTGATAVTTGTTALNIDASAVTNALAITGNSGVNSLIGTSSNDTITGGAGIDKMNGGNGSDIYLINASAEHTAAEITDKGTTGIDEVRFASTTAKETLTLFAGDTGIETVVIGTGTATTAVTTATTALNVNASGVLNALNIIGNAGANTLTGTAYGDTFTGGAGADLFVFNTLPASAANRDVITDFQPGVDFLQFSKAVFTKFTSAAGKVLSAAEFWSGTGVIAGHDTSDRVVYDTTTGNLYYDADGNGAGAAVLVALVGITTHPALAATNIQIIA